MLHDKYSDSIKSCWQHHAHASCTARCHTPVLSSLPFLPCIMCVTSLSHTRPPSPSPTSSQWCQQHPVLTAHEQRLVTGAPANRLNRVDCRGAGQCANHLATLHAHMCKLRLRIAMALACTSAELLMQVCRRGTSKPHVRVTAATSLLIPNGMAAEHTTAARQTPRTQVTTLHV